MSRTEQPDTPPLTRKQMRDIRNTGATPVITADAVVESASPPEAPRTEESAPVVSPPAAPAVAPLPRAAVPVVVHDAPAADASVDLGVSPLTRRQARQQERIRTASVPVITPEVAAAYAAASTPALDETPVDEIAVAPMVDDASNEETPTAVLRELFEIDSDEEENASPAEADASAADSAEAAQPAASEEIAVVEAEVVDAPAENVAPADVADDSAADLEQVLGISGDEEPAGEADPAPIEETPEPERPVLSPLFGSALVEGDAATVDLPTSFDQLLGRGSSGSNGTASALILTQSTGGSPIVAPVTATGEMLVTGTLNLPEGLGSMGHAPGAADGKEVDAVLVDGELPAHSSPTPIAASAAISTVKSNGDVIKPPAPEKGSRLMMTLAITAGVLALALVGVLILAFVNGVF